MPKRTRVVIGGVDTHGRTHHAAAIDQQGRLLGDREFPADSGEFPVQLGQPGDVMGQAELASPDADGIDHAQLMVAATPIDPDEQTLPVGVQYCLHGRPPSSSAATSPWRARLDAHLGARSTTPAGQCQARHHREGRVCTPDLEGHAAKVLSRR
jgi:hypothetical protein